MQKISTIVIGGVAAIALAAAAHAQPFSPAGTVTLSNNGQMSFSQGFVQLQCGLTGTATIDQAGNGAFTDLRTTGSELCQSISFNAFPYRLSSNGPATLTIHAMSITSALGSCSGNLTGSYNQATGQITFNRATIASGTPCTVSGTVNTTPAISF